MTCAIATARIVRDATELAPRRLIVPLVHLGEPQQPGLGQRTR